MEKRYWIFVDSATIERVKNGGQVFAVIYFLYDFAHGGRSGYGMISEYDSKANSFVHRDMWVDQESTVKHSL